jgi:hypothetical protein
MTTVFDISLQVMKTVGDVLESAATDGGANYLTDTLNLTQPNEYWDRGTLWIKSGTQAGKTAKVTGYLNNMLRFQPLASVLCVQQVETATVVGTVTGDGDAAVVVTAAGMLNSPKTLNVAVLNLDTASQVATKIRTALNADAEVKAFFTISGSGAEVILTTKTARANDATMNLSVDNGTCTGLTAAPTSANTTAGVAGPRYALARGLFPWEQVVAKLQSALDETWVTGEDATLTGDGETLDFALPTGVYDVKEVRLERAGRVDLALSTHWHEGNGGLRFDYGYAPYDGDVLHLFYRARHDELTGYATEIHTEIDRDWLALTAARELLMWGAEQYGAKGEMMIEDKLNMVLARLKGRTARFFPDVMIKTAGGGRGT